MNHEHPTYPASLSDGIYRELGFNAYQSFHTRLINADEVPFLTRKERKKFLRNGGSAQLIEWNTDTLEEYQFRLILAVNEPHPHPTAERPTYVAHKVYRYDGKKWHQDITYVDPDVSPIMPEAIINALYTSPDAAIAAQLGISITQYNPRDISENERDHNPEYKSLRKLVAKGATLKKIDSAQYLNSQSHLPLKENAFTEKYGAQFVAQLRQAEEGPKYNFYKKDQDHADLSQLPPGHEDLIRKTGIWSENDEFISVTFTDSEGKMRHVYVCDQLRSKQGFTWPYTEVYEIVEKNGQLNLHSEYIFYQPKDHTIHTTGPLYVIEQKRDTVSMIQILAPMSDKNEEFEHIALTLSSERNGTTLLANAIFPQERMRTTTQSKAQAYIDYPSTPSLLLGKLDLADDRGAINFYGNSVHPLSLGHEYKHTIDSIQALWHSVSATTKDRQLQRKMINVMPYISAGIEFYTLTILAFAIKKNHIPLLIESAFTGTVSLAINTAIQGDEYIKKEFQADQSLLLLRQLLSTVDIKLHGTTPDSQLPLLNNNPAARAVAQFFHILLNFRIPNIR